MTNEALVEKTVFFYLNPETQRPYYPTFTEKVKRYLAGQIECTPFEGVRAGSNDLLIARTHPASLALLMESSAPYMGDYMRDLEMVVFRTETSSQPLDGSFILAPYLELRDDRRLVNAGPLADYFSNSITSADKLNKLLGLSVWDPHGALGLNILRTAFKTKGREITIIPLTAIPLFTEHFENLIKNKIFQERKTRDDFVVWSPDIGALHRSMLLARKLNLEVVLSDKSRPEVGKVKFHGLYMAHPDTGIAVAAPENILAGREALMIDDALATTGTAVDGSRGLKKYFGPSQIHLAVTHTTYVQPNASEKLGNALITGIIDSVVVTDTLPSCHDIPGIKVLSVAEPSAKLLMAVAGVNEEENLADLEPFFFNPGPIKEDLNPLLANGKLLLRPDLWPYNHPEAIQLPRRETVFTFERSN